MTKSIEQATCSRCGVVAILTPIGTGYRHSVCKADMGQCPSNLEHAQWIGLNAPEIDCDHLLDAVSLEYKRLLLLASQTERGATAERVRVRRTAEDIIEVGRDLIDMKTKLGHGNFGLWLDAEFTMSDDTASRFMRVARRAPQIPHAAEYQASVLYELTARNTPDEVVAQVEARTAAGETVTVEEVKALKRAAGCNVPRLAPDSSRLRHRPRCAGRPPAVSSRSAGGHRPCRRVEVRSGPERHGGVLRHA